MDALRSWVENLVTLVIVATLSEMVLPDGSPRKFVRLVLGLVVILAIIQPLGSLMGGKGWLNNLSVDVEKFTAATKQPTTNWLEEAGRVRSAGLGAAQDDAGKSFGREVAALLLLVPGVKDASVDATVSGTGQIESLDARVIAEGATADDVSRRVRAFLLHAYDVSPARIVVHVTAPTATGSDAAAGGAPMRGDAG